MGTAVATRLAVILCSLNNSWINSARVGESIILPSSKIPSGTSVVQNFPNL